MTIFAHLKKLMVSEKDELASAKRRLILKDSLGFLTLLVITLLLAGVTLLLFRSFIRHRAELAQRWSQRGVEAMQSGKPDDAIVALRTALTYAPDTRRYELLLAEALGAAGRNEPARTEESFSRFMSLWEKQPGDGYINLQLARLAARRGDRSAAVEFYRASIFGTWSGDGVIRRAEVRLELARYLIALGDLQPARMELLTAAGNVPETPAFDRTLGDLLAKAHDPTDAASFYEKALVASPRDAGLLEALGELAFQAGDWGQAHRLLARAVNARAEASQPVENALAEMARNAGRLAELEPSSRLSVRARGERILRVRQIAKNRLDTCVNSLNSSGTPLPPPVQRLQAAWAAPEGRTEVSSLRNDPDRQDATLRLIYDTEQTTQAACGRPTGDDALLLVLAERAAPVPGQSSAVNMASAPARDQK